MDMHGVGQPQLIHRRGNSANDLSRRDIEIIHDGIESGYIATLMVFPNLHSTGVDQLGRVSLGGSQ